jgi:hypothetical protein
MKKNKGRAFLLKRFFYSAFSLVFAIALILAVVSYVFKDEISTKLLQYGNSVTQGELVIDQVSLAPFKFFPDVTVKLQGVAYFEQDSSFRASDTIPIVQLDYAYLAVDLLDLLKGELTISKVSIKNGACHLVSYPDQSTNLSRSFRLNARGDNFESTASSASGFRLDFREAEIQNIMFNYHNAKGQCVAVANVNHLQGTLSISPETIESQVIGRISIAEVNLGDGYRFHEKQFELESQILFNSTDKTLQINEAKLALDAFKMNVDGYFGFGEREYLEFEISGTDEGLSIFEQLPLDSLNIIDGGQSNFSGRIYANTLSDIPNFDMQFDLENVSVQLPNAPDTLQINKLDQFRILVENIRFEEAKPGQSIGLPSFKMILSSNYMNTSFCELDDVKISVNAKKGVFEIEQNIGLLFGINTEAKAVWKPFDAVPSLHAVYREEQFNVALLSDILLEDTLMLGLMDISIDVTMTGNTWQEVTDNLSGQVDIYGKDLVLVGADLDAIMEDFKRSRQFTLADAGAIFLMGPAGIFLSKGSDYAHLMSNKGDTSLIREISTRIEINKGRIDLTDVAFATDKNRMAAKGEVNLKADSLFVEIALLNERGCSLFVQQIQGRIEDPALGKLKVVNQILSPVSSLVKSIFTKKCPPFYNGRVQPSTLQ